MIFDTLDQFLSTYQLTPDTDKSPKIMAPDYRLGAKESYELSFPLMNPINKPWYRSLTALSLYSSQSNSTTPSFLNGSYNTFNNDRDKISGVIPEYFKSKSIPNYQQPQSFMYDTSRG